MSDIIGVYFRNSYTKVAAGNGCGNYSLGLALCGNVNDFEDIIFFVVFLRFIIITNCIRKALILVYVKIIQRFMSKEMKNAISRVKAGEALFRPVILV